MNKIISVSLNVVLSLVLICTAWAITDSDRELAMKATECFEQKDFHCARKGYEKLLESDLNDAESVAVKKMLRSAYFDLVKANAENEQFPKSVETYCLKGISMGDELKSNYDEEDVGFHVWLTMYYFQHDNKVQTRRWIGELETIRENITGRSEVDKAARDWIGRVVSAIERRIR
jgi:hypothetical protein